MRAAPPPSARFTKCQCAPRLSVVAGAARSRLPQLRMPVQQSFRTRFRSSYGVHGLGGDSGFICVMIVFEQKMNGRVCSKTWPNQAAPPKPAGARLFDPKPVDRGLAEPRRWAEST